MKLLFLCIVSICIPTIGTLSHEFGHYIMAKLLGYNAYIHYSFVRLDPVIEEKIGILEHVLILSGGVLQTVFTSLLAFILLCKSNLILTSFYFRWILIYFSLFVSREVINFITALIMGCIHGKDYFGLHSDEKNISILLGFWYGSIPIFMFISSLAFILFIIRKFIDRSELLPFFLITSLGGSLGMYIWLYVLGPKWLP